MAKEPLQGVRVLDFTWMLAGPYATRILADFGAEVIKVQCGKTAKGAEENRGGDFHFWNRNKKSITLDLDHLLARELALGLVSKCDVVVENFSPRVMANWCTAYPDLQKVRPDLIMLSMSAAGQTGPGRDRVAYAPTLHALSGFTRLTSYPGGAPLGLGYPYGDVAAGLYGALSVLAALELRDRTGQGQHIDLSEYEALCSLLGPSLMQAALCPDEDPFPEIAFAPHGCYPCLGEDRWCVISVSGEEEWRGLCRAMGDSALAVNRDFSSPSDRQRNAAALEARIGLWTRSWPAEEVAERLQKAGVPAGVVQDAADLVSDPQLAARNYFVPIRHSAWGHTMVDGSPIKFCKEPSPSWEPSPRLGEHNREVFQGLLGLTDEEYSCFLKQGVIA